MKPSFIALDFELANSSHASICSVGMVKVLDGQVAATVHEHVRPMPDYAYTHWRNRELARLDESLIAAANTFDHLGPRLAAALDGWIVVGHNIVRADMSMFTQSWFAAGLEGPVPGVWFVDTEQLARTMVPGLDNYRLNTVYEAVTGTPMLNHHSPDADAVASAAVVCGLLDDHEDLRAVARWRHPVTRYRCKPIKSMDGMRALPVAPGAP